MKALQRFCSHKGSNSGGSHENRSSIYLNGISLDENGLPGLLGKELEQPYNLIVSAFDGDNFDSFAQGIKWIKLLMHSRYVQSENIPVVHIWSLTKTAIQSALVYQQYIWPSSQESWQWQAHRYHFKWSC